MNLLFALLIAAHAAPKIEMKKGEIGRPVLGAQVEAALNKANPEFKMFTAKDYLPSVRLAFQGGTPDETPMAIVGDFNGDGRQDIVVMGSAKNERLVYAVLSTNNDYVAQLVDREALEAEPLYPAMTEGDQEITEDENETWREAGIDTYLSLQRANYREPGIVTFKLDTLILETFRAESRLFPFRAGALREWKPTVARESATSR